MYARYFSFYPEHNHAAHSFDDPWIFPEKNKFPYGGIPQDRKQNGFLCSASSFAF